MQAVARRRPTRSKQTASGPALLLVPAEAAKAARLRYVSDDTPGIRRLRSGKGFRYVHPDGTPVRDAKTLERIRTLVLPPAWRNVWICPQDDGHIQATGRDDRGRKQYRYHHRWRVVRDEAKFDRMVAFGHALPKLRKQVAKDLSLPGLPREKVLATVVRLLEATLIRVGNEEYARQNKSYGLTTLRGRHVAINGSTLRFSFRGKSGVRHEVAVTDRRLARILKQLQDLPGQELFLYESETGVTQAVQSADVNEYLREVTGQPFTAKDFRTWAGTLLAAQALQSFAAFDSKVHARRNVVEAIDRVARRLGNTRTICRQCYVHPAIVDAYLDGTLAVALRARAEQELTENLSQLPPEEAAVIAFLQQRLQNGSKQPNRCKISSRR